MGRARDSSLLLLTVCLGLVSRVSAACKTRLPMCAVRRKGGGATEMLLKHENYECAFLCTLCS